MQNTLKRTCLRLPADTADVTINKCVLLADDITKLVHLCDRANESFPASYKLCYQVCLMCQKQHDLSIVERILSFAIERAAGLLITGMKGAQEMLTCRTYFDRRVLNLQDTMMYWRSHACADRQAITDIAAEAWDAVLRRKAHVRFLVLALMSAGLCTEIAVCIKDYAME